MRRRKEICPIPLIIPIQPPFILGYLHLYPLIFHQLCYSDTQQRGILLFHLVFFCPFLVVSPLHFFYLLPWTGQLNFDINVRSTGAPAFSANGESETFQQLIG